MADEPHDDADASQPGDPESSSDGGELSDDHDAVATGFEVDDGESQDFDAETGEYDAAPDEVIPDGSDDLEGDESGEEFVLDEDSPEELEPESGPTTEADDLHEEPVDEDDMFDGGAPADEEPAEAVSEDLDQSQPVDELIEETDEAGFADESAEMDDDAATGDLEHEGEVDEEMSADESSGGIDDAEAADDTPEEQTLGDEESDGAEADEFPLQPELDSILDAPEPESVDVEPLPEVGPYRDPATLTLWVAGDKHETFAVAQEELVIGDAPAAETEHEQAEPDVAPDIDLGPYVDSETVWGRHAALYRHNKNYTLYAISDGATQINDEVLELGEHRRLEDGDIVVVAGEAGLEFSLPEARDVAGHGTAPGSDAELAEKSSTDPDVDEPEVDREVDDEAEFTEEAPVDEPLEELDEADFVAEQPDPDAPQMTTGDLPDETPPPPDESGGFDDPAVETPADPDPAPEDEWDDEPLEDDDFV